MESTGRTSSCLAISEKKKHKPGGCVGIFFQLFDWNRRLAKKKLFSRKLLPPARTKQATKKFKGGEKMPTSKNHLIADENRGGFPNAKKNGNRCTDKEHKNEMRVPGLVARLMGLESMPVINRDTPKKTVFPNPCDNVEDLNLEKLSAKTEARPLKLRKTVLEEGKVLRRIGAEVLQYKSIMSRSRKHPPPPKLPSSAKSPRLHSGRNASRASRLIDVASKILEPGLQASNRTKSAVALPKSMHYSSNEVISREIGVVPLEGYDFSKTFMGQASCKNCNNLLKVEVFNHSVEEYPSAIPPVNSTYGNVSLQGSGRNKTITPELPLQQERDEVRQPNCDQPKTSTSKHNESKGCIISHVDSLTERMPLNKHNESKGCIISHVNSITERMPVNNESPCPSFRLSSHQFKPRANESSIVKHCSKSEDHLASVRDRMQSKSSIPMSRRTALHSTAVGGTKNFVALNRSLNGCSKGKLLGHKGESSKFGLERKSFNGGEGILSQSGTTPRKRRTAHLSGQIESKASVDSPAAKQRTPQCDKLSRASSRLNRKALPVKQPCTGNRFAGHRDAADRVCRKDNDIVSFIFNAPVTQKTTVATEINESIENERNMSSQKLSSFGGDALDILEQKLKELTSLGDDDSASGSPMKKPASIIIQELIAAVAAARKVSLEDSTVNMDVTSCDDLNEERLTKTSKGRDHLSPGSVLEASFSSSSMDESSGCRMPAESVDCSIDQLQLSEPDTELLDSATSLSERNVGNERLTKVFNAISNMLQSYDLTGIRLTGSKLSHAKEVMLNTEILFSEDESNLLILPLFIDELETFTCEMWTNFSSVISSLEDSKEVNHLRGFLFDCLIECLDSKHSQLYYGGSNALIRTAPVQNARALIRDLEKEIKKRGHFVGMMTDEIVEWEMSNSLGKWNDFSVEELECGAEIDGDILQILVEEIVTELWECRKGVTLNVKVL